MKSRTASFSWHTLRGCVIACVLAAQAGCKTGQPVNAPPEKATAVNEWTDAEMQPSQLLADCAKLTSAGSYRTGSGSEAEQVTFFLDRDPGTDSIPRLQRLMESFEYSLVQKKPHVAHEPDEGASALWMEIVPSHGKSGAMLIMNGTSIVTSDKVHDWHWSGGSRAMLMGVIDALAPRSSEQHAERVEGEGGAGSEGGQLTP